MDNRPDTTEIDLYKKLKGDTEIAEAVVAVYDAAHAKGHEEGLESARHLRVGTGITIALLMIMVGFIGGVGVMFAYGSL
jgi:hypothetical protein